MKACIHIGFSFDKKKTFESALRVSTIAKFIWKETEVCLLDINN
jgi:hypothetical protein